MLGQLKARTMFTLVSPIEWPYAHSTFTHLGVGVTDEELHHTSAASLADLVSFFIHPIEEFIND